VIEFIQKKEKPNKKNRTKKEIVKTISFLKSSLLQNKEYPRPGDKFRSRLYSRGRLSGVFLTSLLLGVIFKTECN
jgi:hypothetical protein